jgi:DNA-binding beta-propeller fold protein YncE
VSPASLRRSQGALFAAALSHSRVDRLRGHSDAWERAAANMSTGTTTAPSTASAAARSNLGAESLSGPEGMAYDTVTNRLFVADSGPEGQIIAIDLGGGGGSPFTAPGAPIEAPAGITLDPTMRTIYWINGNSNTISWALLDGSVGGVLNTSGPVDAYRLALDPVARRVYWFDSTGETVRYANVDNSGGGPLNLAGATPADFTDGIAVDPAGGRVFWVNEGLEKAPTKTISFAALSGAGGGDLPLGAGVFDSPYGLAFDPSLQKIYWGNYNRKEGAGAIGFLGIDGIGGGIDIATAPVDGPQDPVIVKSPTATAAPVLARSGASGGARAALTCPVGAWTPDYPGSFVYQAPRSYAYQWLLDGTPISGAVGATYTATKPGSYTCAVTATNQAGTGATTSAPLKVKAAKFKLIIKTKKPKAKPGKLATIKVQAYNQGDFKSKNSRVCVKPTRGQRKYVKQPKCKQIGKVGPKKRKTTKLKVKLKGNAEGAYRLKIVVKGTGGKAAFSRVKVVG